MTIEKIISELVCQKRESTYWDFKEKHHSTKVDLLHDVLCLANCDHIGSRYLIFGVSDGSWKVIGVDEYKSQQYFLDFFHNLARSFAGNMVPEFILHDVKIDTKPVQVLEIFDRPHKPYRLIEVFSQGSNKLHPNIFSRVQDRNVPKDRSATQSQLDRMYRQRFGMELSPLERFKLFLTDPEAKWGSIDLGRYYCEQSPEFTFEYLGNSEPTNYEWLRGEIGHSYQDGSTKSQVAFYMHQTKLAEITYVNFDGGKKVCVNPTYQMYGRGRFYYFASDSLSYAFQLHLINERGSDFTRGLNKSGVGGTFAIPVTTEITASAFCKSSDQSFAAPETNEKLQNESFYKAIEDFAAFVSA